MACTEIRRSYQCRQIEYRHLQQEGMTILNRSASINDLKMYLDKLDAAINVEQQREQIYRQEVTPMEVKVEPDLIQQNEFVIVA
jgi:hypothetical protein